jgi:hypothetical protein
MPGVSRFRLLDMHPPPRYYTYLSLVGRRLLSDGFTMDEGLKVGDASCDLFCRKVSRFGSAEYVYVAYFDMLDVESASEFLSLVGEHARAYSPLPPPPNSLTLFQVLVTPNCGPEVESLILSSDRASMAPSLHWSPWESAVEYPVLVELDGRRLVRHEEKGRIGVWRRWRYKAAKAASEYFSFQEFDQPL